MIGYYFNKEALSKFCKYLINNPLPGYKVHSGVHYLHISNANFAAKIVYRYSKYEILSACNRSGTMYIERHLLNAKYTDEIPYNEGIDKYLNFLKNES